MGDSLDLKLHWVLTFTALGITFDVRDLINTTLLNCSDKMIKLTVKLEQRNTNGGENLGSFKNVPLP